MIFYMIRHKASGEWMPELKRTRGYSFWNPSKVDTVMTLGHKLTGCPRFFVARRKAHRSIVQWNACPNARYSIGQSDWFGHEGLEIKDDGRSKDDLEIVEVELKVR